MGKIVPRASVLRQKVSAPSHSLEIVELRVASKLTGNEIILFQFRTNFETKLDFCQAHADHSSPSVAHIINSGMTVCRVVLEVDWSNGFTYLK